ncbi:MAG: hypothetical protein ACRDST_10820 [Pseudonocardiaceae bacterium]
MSQLVTEAVEHGDKFLLGEMDGEVRHAVWQEHPPLPSLAEWICS